MARHIVFGLGETGQSFARYLQDKQIAFEAADSRESSPQLEQFKKDYPDVFVSAGPFDSHLYENADTFYLSPGLDPKQSFFAEASNRGIKLCGDIEVFKQEAQAPIVAITGTNGKSTVTAWLNHVGSFSNKVVAMGGNIGIPALNLLHEPTPDFYVIELSSFQLELYQPEATGFFAGCVTNITDDHLDRHVTFEEYALVKKRIYHEKSFNVYNADDKATYPDNDYRTTRQSFGLDTEARYHVAMYEDELHLMNAHLPILPVKELSLIGRQNWQNALAVVALADCMGLEKEALLEGLKTFTGLEHRCQLVRELNGVKWFNDSKGTNVGASIAAIKGVADNNDAGRVCVILGGQGKGADFKPLAEVLKTSCHKALVFGEDAPVITQACENSAVSYTETADLSAAIELAYTEMKSGDVVLFSPACASFDMFKSFSARGDYFMEEVLKLK